MSENGLKCARKTRGSRKTVSTAHSTRVYSLVNIRAGQRKITPTAAVFVFVRSFRSREERI